MRKRKILRLGTVTFIVVLALFTTMANAQSPYEIWSCGGLNLQGYQDQSTIQFYPFNAKIGDLYKIDFREYILAINPSISGNFFAYLCFRADGAPIYWFYFDANFNIINSTELFSSCTWHE